MAFRRIAMLGGLCCCMGLAACALRYAEPQADQASAELVVLVNTPIVLQFYRDAARCTDALIAEPPPSAGGTSYRIPAGKDFAMRFFYIDGVPVYGAPSWTACKENIVSFHPETAHRYQLRYTVDSGGCRWDVTEAREGQDLPVRVSERERDPTIMSMGGEGTWCKAKTGAPSESGPHVSTPISHY